ncbi:hypothetical protein HO173_004589 [Letharia columbiana]|uniref:CoA-transferase family III n=1 Tax=Letharia columbiana TaxID=112416 RepID=A0A8H6L6A6_9LECA|nr:uncharacterized protein HO173_004589 [Letharia columbiana]KAF6237121.1 hypothetical protein HO173_004589 [Letharia columbiana]
MLNGEKPYSLQKGIHSALKDLLRTADGLVPLEVKNHLRDMTFESKGHGDVIGLPCPLKETEAVTALKAVEASTIAAITDLRFGMDKRDIRISVERATCFLFAAYLSTVDGMAKGDPNVKSKLKDTDLLKAQSILYRRFAANLYETRTPGEYFHLHGSLEATTSLNMIGLEGYRPDVTDYHDCLNLIESHMKKFSPAELEAMNAKHRQAGVTCLKYDDFKKTHYGRSKLDLPPWTLENLEISTPPVPFPARSSTTNKPQPLAGIRVLELCRIIAGPVIGRTLAEYGADVLKVTAPHLSDVPFFQVDGNMGKHATELNLRDPNSRQVFESLLQTADILVDGYRPGSLTRLGYGPSQILQLIQSRNKGIIYISESCFGALPPSSNEAPDSEASQWSQRPGWQQIADCVTGVAWTQGTEFLDLEGPVIPPFPMSDYGTGCAGAIAALTGLYKRATEGGSWWGGVSLVGYNVYLLSLGLYPPEVVDDLKSRFRDAGFYGKGEGGLRHSDSVDEVGKRALSAMKQVRPELFAKENFDEAWSQGFGAKVRYAKSAVDIAGIRVGFSRGTRPNGTDEAGWDGWEVETR